MPCSLPPFQNGRFTSAEGPVERERLVMQDRPQRSILLCPPTPISEEIHSVSMGGSTLRIRMSLFWTGASSTNFHKALENSNSCVEKIIYLDDILLMAKTISEMNMARDTLIFLFQQLGFVINLRSQC